MAKHASRFRKVAREVILEVPELYQGYHKVLLRKLTEVIGCQGSGFATAARRREVRRVLEAFGQQAAAQTKTTEEV